MHALKEDGWQDTCLHYAASRGHLQCVRVLLAFKADPAAKNYAGALVARWLWDVMAYWHLL